MRIGNIGDIGDIGKNSKNTSPPPVIDGTWLLTGGVWDDTGVWLNSATWED